MRKFFFCACDEYGCDVCDGYTQYEPQEVAEGVRLARLMNAARAFTGPVMTPYLVCDWCRFKGHQGTASLIEAGVYA